MDINYIRENEIHEKYILNQLDEKEKQAYEAFIESSPEAKQELEQTKKLIEGVRAVGSSAMRKEIEEQVAALRNPKTDWSTLYKAAAVLFIFVLLPAIFYYQHNFADQLEITEQLVTESFSEPQTIETKEKAQASEYVPEEETDEDIFEDPEAKQSATEDERSSLIKIESSPKALEVSATGKAKYQNIQNEIVVDEKITTSKKDKSKGGSAVEGISIFNDLAGEALEGEVDVVGSAANLDEVLSRAAGSGADMQSKSDLPGAAKVAAPSRSIGMDYIPPKRSFTFINNNNTLILNLNRANLRNAFPDLIKINIKKDSVDQTTLDMFVSDQLHSFEREDINVEWEKEDHININFSDKAIYKVKLEEDQKTAQMIK